jgi:hypothetical protein
MRVGANPAQLLAVGWSACFESAIAIELLSKLYRNFNNIRVRSFILSGAPFRIEQRTRLSVA